MSSCPPLTLIKDLSCSCEEDRSSTFCCLNCVVSFCGQHGATHQRRAPKHKVISVDEDVTYVNYEEHCEEYAFFCEDDLVLVCNYPLDHQGHRVIRIKLADEKNEESLNLLQENLALLKKNLESQVKDVESCLQDLKKNEEGCEMQREFVFQTFVGTVGEQKK